MIPILYEYKLLIYIPTYNRAASLLKQLKAIDNNINKSLITIIVNDNASTDVEYKNIQQYCLENQYIYNKNSFNIGADANIFNGFMQHHKAEYIWILSDDDILYDSSVVEIMNILNTNDLDLLFLTHSKINLLKINSWTQKDFYENNIQTSDGAGLISNVIYKSNFIKNSIPQGFNNIHTCFAHLAILIHSFKNKIVKVGNIGSYNFFVPDTALPPADSTGYDRSYFGFVLLGELFEEPIKKRFINDWTSFINLRFWYKKFILGYPNSIYADAYIKDNLYIFNFFRTKLFFWKLFSGLFFKILSKMNSKLKNTIREFVFKSI